MALCRIRRWWKLSSFSSFSSSLNISILCSSSCSRSLLRTGANKVVPSNMQQMMQRVSLVSSIVFDFHNLSSYPYTATLRIYTLSARAREANQTHYAIEEFVSVAKMPEGVDISSITYLEDIKSCIASIEQEEVITSCYAFVCSALIRIYEVLLLLRIFTW